MKTTDGRDKDILDKQGVETDVKDREETLKDTPISRNSVKESQQTLFPREEEDKRKAKITVQTIEEAMTTNEQRTPVSVTHPLICVHTFVLMRFRLSLLHPRRPRGGQSSGRKGATKVFKHRQKSPWGPTLTGPFPNGQANVGSWLGTKNALYYCAQ